MIEAYHGTNANIERFSLDYVGEGYDQEGPGIYFTNDRDDATGYGKFVYHVALDIARAPRLKKRAKITEIRQIINWASDLEDKLCDWDEDPKIAFDRAVKSCMLQDNEHQSFLTVWYEFYRYRPQEYLKNMIELGFDGAIIPSTTYTNVIHYVMFNPRKIIMLDNL